ncbi:MAG: tetratricopeptide repeat protein [Acidobacteriota bacterium]
MLCVAMCAVAGLIGLALTQFITSVMADPKVRTEPVQLRAAADYFPNSAGVQARMAAYIVEAGVDESLGHESESALAIRYAERAVNLSPWNYEHRMVLAAAREWKDDPARAEAELRQALALAPHHVEVNWRLANLLVRQGKFQESLDKFKTAVAADPRRLSATLNLLWQASDGNIEFTGSVAASDPKAQLSLAKFLTEQGKVEEALSILSRLDKQSLIDLPESGKLLDAMLAAGQVKPAAQFWKTLFQSTPEQKTELIRNGSFETPVKEGFTQFDWNLRQGKYAQLGISSQARTGQRSLKIIYNGLDTTRLDGEIRQLVPVEAGARYRLICYVRASRLVTPSAPQLVVASADAKTTLGAAAIPTGSYDWQQWKLDFAAPAETRAVVVTIRQTPKFSFVDATEGTVWMDDFVLIRQ